MARAAFKKTLIYYLCGRIAALRGARNLDIFLYMPRFLRSVRLALHPAQIINQRFLKKTLKASSENPKIKACDRDKSGVYT